MFIRDDASCAREYAKADDFPKRNGKLAQSDIWFIWHLFISSLSLVHFKANHLLHCTYRKQQMTDRSDSESGMQHLHITFWVYEWICVVTWGRPVYNSPITTKHTLHSGECNESGECTNWIFCATCHNLNVSQLTFCSIVQNIENLSQNWIKIMTTNLYTQSFQLIFISIPNYLTTSVLYCVIH